MTIIELKYDVGERVYVDDHEIRGVITQICIHGGCRIIYEVQWFNNGSLCSGWFNESRLTVNI